MDISIRLRTIADMVSKCNCCADIGTDHGYIPIYLVKNRICNRAIASDINKGPIEKAKKNIELEGLEKYIECRIGGGLTTIKPNEANSAIIAGMGGNLIRDIIEESKEVFKSLDYIIAQPVQNPEILREYIYTEGYEILQENLCIDENKYYEIMKIRYNNKIQMVDSIFYEISKYMLENKHPLIEGLIIRKIDKYEKICHSINEDTELANNRKREVKDKIYRLKELLLCL
ncbi:tRNA (adenine(22)-N(1))-methyltransferase [Clostridium liquoris]|jgi:tRNA (adenine22-N1)-methyltransferase|uniref:tRNA (Adenine(22)-N(1))-methyltransferase n=1 Tax=Clostridium liquoris TaxID=1289519 RepID=A0A2T0B0X6_9CLOT|nr:class I SAM-dependent methyltransferase [Clostridium liquoris]PRR77226.1 tRNA (adenine(22)-N(1))-methyltransferase [Clostridium liquoris]